MRARLRFDLNPDLIVRQPRQVLAHHQSDLPAARLDGPAHQVVDQPLRKLIGVAFGIVQLNPEFVDRAFDGVAQLGIVLQLGSRLRRFAAIRAPIDSAPNRLITA